MTIDIKPFIGPCSCGRSHKVELEQLIIESGAILKLPEVIKACVLSGTAFIVCDKNTYKAAAKTVEQVLTTAKLPYKTIILEEPVQPDEVSIEAIEKQLNGKGYLIAVGSGCINDLGKYVATDNGMKSIAIATAASVDGFASTVAAMTLKGFKMTAFKNPPVAIIADTDIFSVAPYRLTASGICDMLGKYTALTDWKISTLISGEYFCQTIHDYEYEAMQKVADSIDEIRKGDKSAYEELMYALVLSGIVMQMMGNSRPASASEHHLSHFWELNVINDSHTGLHGEMVAVGLVEVRKAYARILDNIKDISKVVQPYKGLDKELLKKYFGSMYNDIIGQSTPDDMLNVTTQAVIDNYDKIVELINLMPTADQLIDMIVRCGGVYKMEQVGLSDDILLLSLKLSPFVRGRISFMRLHNLMLGGNLC